MRRFAENPHLQGFTARGPQLFLGQTVGAGGALSPALSAALADPKERVIGAVSNVVDAQPDGAEPGSYTQLTLPTPYAFVPCFALLPRVITNEFLLIQISHTHVPLLRKGRRWK